MPSTTLPPVQPKFQPQPQTRPTFAKSPEQFKPSAPVQSPTTEQGPQKPPPENLAKNWSTVLLDATLKEPQNTPITKKNPEGKASTPKVDFSQASVFNRPDLVAISRPLPGVGSQQPKKVEPVTSTNVTPPENPKSKTEGSPSGSSGSKGEKTVIGGKNYVQAPLNFGGYIGQGKVASEDGHKTMKNEGEKTEHLNNSKEAEVKLQVGENDLQEEHKGDERDKSGHVEQDEDVIVIDD